MKSILRLTAWVLVAFVSRSFGERINQEGRILGALPAVTNSVLFNTPEADAIVSAMQIFPVTNAWNEDISHRPVLVNSDAMIAQIISDLAPANRSLIAFYEMNFVLVPNDQPVVPIDFFKYPDESDLDGGTFPNGLYPIPPNLPIETWPHDNTNTLSAWQQATNSGDRHAIILQPGNGFIWETWLTKLTGTNWAASNGAKFDLKSNALRPTTWTSADAAGLPMFPALPRFDEGERGRVEHACRIVVKRSRREFIYPATHFASSTPATQTNVPAMGQRVRLKSGFVTPSNWTKQEKAVLLALKKYGAMVADNGSFFSISVTPDNRWPSNCFNNLTSIAITNFEVIQTSGPNEGPRSPDAPMADAGADQTLSLLTSAQLQGFVTFTGAPPLIQWTLYSGPSTVTFGNPGQTNTTATFAAPGIYTLILSADDDVHAVAYDAVVITVTNAINLSFVRTGTTVNFNWSGGSPPFVLEKTETLPATSWSEVVTTNSRNASVPISASNQFFRIRGQ